MLLQEKDLLKSMHLSRCLKGPKAVTDMVKTVKLVHHHLNFEECFNQVLQHWQVQTSLNNF